MFHLLNFWVILALKKNYVFYSTFYILQQTSCLMASYWIIFLYSEKYLCRVMNNIVRHQWISTLSNISVTGKYKIHCFLIFQVTWFLTIRGSVAFKKNIIILHEWSVKPTIQDKDHSHEGTELCSRRGQESESHYQRVTSFWKSISKKKKILKHNCRRHWSL